MVQAFAINTVHLLREAAEKGPDGKIIKPPTIEVIPAGKVFEALAEQFKELEAAGAIRKPTKMDAAISEGADLPASIETAAGKPASAMAPQAGVARR
jgi:hypothetical protein